MDLKHLLNKEEESGEMGMKEKSKLSVLEELRDAMSELMRGGLDEDSMQKVTIASDSPEGLSEGLDKAEELVEDMPEDEMEMAGEEYENEDAMSLEELEAKIKELEMKKMAMMGE